jgi:hypothetical protein
MIDLTTLLQIAAWKATTEMLEYLLLTDFDKQDSAFSIDNILATAIEAENLPNIKYLLSHGANMLRGGYIYSRVSRQMPQRRIKISGRRDLDVVMKGLNRAISLFRPDLMAFLVNDCKVVLPSAWTDAEDIFRYPAFWQADPIEIRSRLAEMRQYIIWPDAFRASIGFLVYYPRTSDIVEFCLQNVVDRNGLDYLLRRTVQGCGIRSDPENVKLLLQFGLNPDYSCPGKDYRKLSGMKKVEAYFGACWKEIVQRIQAGEDLEGNQHRKS